MNVIRGFGPGFHPGDTTINGVNSTAFARARETPGLRDPAPVREYRTLAGAVQPQ